MCINQAACPAHSDCNGGDYAPAPNKGYWVDRTSYKYVTHIYRCPRSTCGGSDSSDACWKFENFTSSSLKCDANTLICTEGAIGPLCGSCDLGYVYNAEIKSCSSCGDAKKFAYTALFFSGFMIIVVVALRVGYQQDNKLSHFVRSLDSGSLKVLWVTYQIIMSVSWNLDIEVRET
jgi:uncharacterized protein (DUF983 family)